MEQRTPGKRINEGVTATIYEWGDGRVLKLLNPGEPQKWAEYEYRMTHAAHEAGLPVPTVDEFTEYNGRHGIIMERIRGLDMQQCMMRKMWKMDYHARILAELQTKINATKAPEEAQPIHQRLEYSISTEKSIPPAMKESVRRVLKELPYGDTICHYDLHPGNIMMSPRGPVIIDWSAMAKGDPMADAARTWCLCTYSSGRTLLRTIVFILLKSFNKAYLRHYRSLIDFNEEKYERWKIPILANRIYLEKETAFKLFLLGVLEKKLASLDKFSIT
jgi:uncharacterized protein (TIGR02172 family)